MVPCIPYSGLRRFASARPATAKRLVGELEGPTAAFGWLLICKFDRCVRNSEVNPELLQLLVALDAVLASDEKEAFLECLLEDARAADAHRQRSGLLRSLWGVTPIINIIASARADRLLGVQAESVVVTSYYTGSNFDLVLKGPIKDLEKSHPQLAGTYRWLALLWALVEFDVIFLFNDQGFLSPVGGYDGALWRFGINLEEMQLLRRAGKRFYTLCYGADYRTRQRTLASGKFNFCMDCPEVGRFCLCDDAAGEKMFAAIKKCATRILGAGLSLDFLPNPLRMDFLVLDTDAIRPTATAKALGKSLRVVHAPNHPFFKGTRYLEAAVARLRAEGRAIELVMLSGVSQDEVIALMRSADLVVDQLIGGNIGLTALEAMALGKPVIGYVRDPARFLVDPATCPVINANPDTIYNILRDLIEDPSWLPGIGRLSREYVVRHHSIPALAARLRSLYVETGYFPPAIRRLLKPGGTSGFRHGMDRALGRTIDLARYAYWRLYVSVWQFNTALQRSAKAWAFKGARRAIKARILFRRTLARIGRIGARNNAGDRAISRPLFEMPAWLSTFTARLSTSAARLSRVSAEALFFATARYLSAWRMRFGVPRTLWGTTPILTLPLLARCDRALGLNSESMVFTVYYTSQNFDIVLKRIFEWVFHKAPQRQQLLTTVILGIALLRYDVFHFFCDRGIFFPLRQIGLNTLEMNHLRRAGKRFYTYAYGADVRTRERTLALGEFNFCKDCPEPGKFCICDDAAGSANIHAIELRATRMLAMGDMLAYVPQAENLHYWPLDLDAISYAPPRQRNGGPLRVAHAPNHPHFKGTKYLEEAIARLRKEGVPIELVRVQGVPNEEVLQCFREVDVVAEQFIGGFHGYTALEAMAIGRPVISFLRGPDMMIDPESCPILNADPRALYGVLKDCALGRHDLEALGRRGRNYVERYYSIPAVAARLGRLYLRSASLPRRWNKKIAARVATLEAGLPTSIAPASGRVPSAATSLTPPGDVLAAR